MLFFFSFFDVRWVGCVCVCVCVCVCGGGGGGGAAWEFAPTHFLPNPIHIYLYGCGG